MSTPRDPQPAAEPRTSARQGEEPRDLVITHPNRDSASAKAMRVASVLVLLASAALSLVIMLGGWDVLAGAVGLWIILTALNVLFAYHVAKWRSGVLPVAAGVAVVSGIFAAVSVGSWFSRGDSGYNEPALPEELIGVLVLGYAILQFVATVILMRSFSQQWQVELEVPREQLRRGHPAAA